MTFLDLASARYSVRKYSEKKVEDEVLEKILDAANMAPTAKNNQPQRIYVIKSDEGIEAIKEATKCHFDAPIVLAITFDKNEEWHNPFEDNYRSGHQDCAIVATHIMLAATDLGLGTCWVNFCEREKAVKAINIPDNEELVLLMPLGYPANDAEPSERHTLKKNIEDTVVYK